MPCPADGASMVATALFWPTAGPQQIRNNWHAHRISAENRQNNANFLTNKTFAFICTAISCVWWLFFIWLVIPDHKSQNKKGVLLLGSVIYCGFFLTECCKIQKSCFCHIWKMLIWKMAIALSRRHLLACTYVCLQWWKL